jgi:acyl dehydratase
LATLITDELKSQIGRETPPYEFRVELGDVLRYSRMVGHPEPWYADERRARASRYGGIVAPPTYLIVMRNLEHKAFASIGITFPYPHGVDGRSEWDYLEPIRPGDTIVAVARIAEYHERDTRLGPTLFQVIESVYRNQFGEVVVRQRDTRIWYP